MNTREQFPFFHTAEAILAHPRFSLARSSYVEALLKLYENDPFMNRLLNEAGKAMTFFMIICLHAAYRENDRSTWPTTRLLQDKLTSYGLSSARRVNDLVGRLATTGYIETVVSPEDKRARILRPTSKMLGHDLNWLEAHYQSLNALFPEPGYGPPLQRDVKFQKNHRIASVEMFAYSAQFLAQNPDALFFVQREAGMPILIKLVQLSITNSFIVKSVSFADLANRFGVSRTHVRILLREAQSMGLTEINGQEIVLTPRLMAAFDRFVADGMAGLDLLFRVATGKSAEAIPIPAAR